MVGVEEALTFRSHLNGDLDPDDREEGISSRAEEAAKKKRQRRGRAKRLCQQCNKNLIKNQEPW
jgi:methionyl aminopeptidase